jgi:hypothetical protein
MTTPEPSNESTTSSGSHSDMTDQNQTTPLYLTDDPSRIDWSLPPSAYVKAPPASPTGPIPAWPMLIGIGLFVAPALCIGIIMSNVLGRGLLRSSVQIVGLVTYKAAPITAVAILVYAILWGGQKLVRHALSTRKETFVDDLHAEPIGTHG